MYNHYGIRVHTMDFSLDPPPKKKKTMLSPFSSSFLGPYSKIRKKSPFLKFSILEIKPKSNWDE